MTEQKQTFGEHLEDLRKMLMRVLIVVVLIAIGVFCFKDTMFDILLAPCYPDFVTYSALRGLATMVTGNSTLFNTQMSLIATDISSQLMTHLAMSIYFSVLLASPYILFELFRFITPALYDNERKYSVRILAAVYVLFIIGTLVSYLMLFPLACRFLVSYEVSPMVTAMPTLDSYSSLFITLTLLMGLVFELPVLCYLLAKFKLIDHKLMQAYRKYALVLIMIVAAIITPPDILTLIIVTIPLYLLYELSIKVVKITK